MKKLLLKTTRFFRSWLFLKIVLWTVTLILLFYAEEDWRGARAWAATKAKWEAKGETFDYSRLFPPPVPDSQNLAAIPLFKLNADSEPRALDQALEAGPLALPSIGNWQEGETPDLEKFRRAIAADYSAVFKGVSPPPGVLAQFEALYPCLAHLRAAAATHPLCRFSSNYSGPMPFARPFGLITDQLKLSKLLTLDAILALHDHQSDLAENDLKTEFQLIAGVRRDPALIAGLVAIATTVVSETAIYDGLASHAWNDSQLHELENMLEPINFLAEDQFALRSEAAGAVTTTDYLKRPRESEIFKLFTRQSGDAASLIDRLYFWWPLGWWDQNKSQITAFDLHLISSVDPVSHRAFPEIANGFDGASRA